MKTCRKCGVEKPLGDFWKREQERKSGRCKACATVYLKGWQRKNRDKTRVYAQTYRDKHPGRVAQARREYLARNPEQAEANRRRSRDYQKRNNHAITLRQNYGLTPRDYTLMWLAQRSGCGVCGGTQVGGRSRLSVDHNHETGAIRGLLCNNCNAALGLLKEDQRRIAALSAYLSRHSDIPGDRMTTDLSMVG